MRATMRLMAIGVAAAALLSPAGGEAQEKTLKVVAWGGASQEAYRKAYWAPFAKEAGVKVLEDTLDGELAKVKAMVEAKNVGWDLIFADYYHAIDGCAQGILVPIDKKILGDTSDYLPGALHECGASVDIFSWVYGYDNNRIPAQWGANRPATVEDVWSPGKFPGKRGFKKHPKDVVELSLIADGVTPDKMESVLKSKDGLDRAFKKFLTLKEHIVFYAKMAQGPQVLGDGEAAILSTVSGRLLAANRQAGKNFGIVWDKQSYSVNIVIIPKGPNADLAMKLLAYKLKPEVMARVPQYVEYGPTRKSAMQYVDAKIAPNLPTAPDHMKNATPRHEAWWADHIQEAQEKWAVLMSKW